MNKRDRTVNNRYVDSTIHKNIVRRRLALEQEFAQELRFVDFVNYKLITPPPLNIR